MEADAQLTPTEGIHVNMSSDRGLFTIGVTHRYLSQECGHVKDMLYEMISKCYDRSCQGLPCR